MYGTVRAGYHMPMIGEKLREARQSQSLSLSQVASKAKVSVATLSRIETNKQGLELTLFLTLARILKTAPQELLGTDGDGHADGSDPLVGKITALDFAERAQLWRDLTAARRTERNQRRAEARHVAPQIEELIAQLDFLREEIVHVRKRLRR